MRTERTKKLVLHHPVADISIQPTSGVNFVILQTLIQLALDSYVETQRVSAEVVHREAALRHGDHYQTPGYYLKLYRTRSDMTQVQLAERADIKQHHLSEMENNKRPIGKKMAIKLAKILNFDYKKLL